MSPVSLFSLQMCRVMNDTDRANNARALACHPSDKVLVQRSRDFGFPVVFQIFIGLRKEEMILRRNLIRGKKRDEVFVD